MNVEPTNNNHSVSANRFHPISVVKYRKKVIDDGISERLKGILRGIESNYNIALEGWDHDMDHAHVLFGSEPNSNISKSVDAYKPASSRLIKKEYPSIRPRLYKEAFWSWPFRLISTGGASMEAIRKYIESQGERSPIQTPGTGGL